MISHFTSEEIKDLNIDDDDGDSKEGYYVYRQKFTIKNFLHSTLQSIKSFVEKKELEQKGLVFHSNINTNIENSIIQMITFFRFFCAEVGLPGIINIYRDDEFLQQIDTIDEEVIQTNDSLNRTIPNDTLQNIKNNFNCFSIINYLQNPLIQLNRLKVRHNKNFVGIKNFKNLFKFEILPIINFSQKILLFLEKIKNCPELLVICPNLFIDTTLVGSPGSHPRNRDEIFKSITFLQDKYGTNFTILTQNYDNIVNEFKNISEITLLCRGLYLSFGYKAPKKKMIDCKLLTENILDYFNLYNSLKKIIDPIPFLDETLTLIGSLFSIDITIFDTRYKQIIAEVRKNLDTYIKYLVSIKDGLIDEFKKYPDFYVEKNQLFDINKNPFPHVTPVTGNINFILQNIILYRSRMYNSAVKIDKKEKDPIIKTISGKYNNTIKCLNSIHNFFTRLLNNI
jgi:hypothetical protein